MPSVVVLDTSVTVAGLRSAAGASHLLLRAVGGGCFTLGLIVALVLEYESVLRRPGLVPLSPGEIDTLIDFWCANAKCCPVRFGVRPAAANPGDEHVLEAAVATGSEYIVTLNARDLRDAAPRYGVAVVTPGEALGRLGVRG